MLIIAPMIKTKKQQQKAAKELIDQISPTRKGFAGKLKVSERYVYDMIADPERLTAGKIIQLSKITGQEVTEIFKGLFA